MEECYCRQLNSDNIEKAFLYCSGDYASCAIYQRVFKADEAMAEAEQVEDRHAVVGLTTGAVRGRQLLSRQRLMVQALTLLESGISPQQMLQDFLCLVRRYAEVDEVSAYIFDGDSNLYAQRVNCSEECQGQARVVQQPGCLCGQILDGGLKDSGFSSLESGAIWANDTARLSAALRKKLDSCTNSASTDRPGGSVALLPVSLAGERVGVLRINARTRNLFTLDDIRFLSGLTSVLSLVVKRSREERHRAYADMIVAQLPYAVAVVDANGVLRKVTGRFESCFKASAAESLGKKLDAVFPASVYRQHLKPMLERAFGGETLSQTGVLPGGCWSATMRLVLSPFFSAEGRVDAVILAFYPCEEGA
ncbi:MAG: PAS domain-containing protein [Desulfuromonadaceae bacterium]|nr:PAS domain-containing protein [Desulfuromonadaceae bacterium]